MSFLDRAKQTVSDLYNDIADEFNAQHSTSPPVAYQRVSYGTGVNVQPETTPVTDFQNNVTNISPHVAAGVPVTGPIDQYVSVTLDNGSGTASIGPQRVREFWSGIVVAVSVSTANNDASCSLYVGSTIQSATFLGQTPNGSSGATATIPNPIAPGYKIFARWTGGDQTAIATMHVTATYQFGGAS